MKIRELLNEEMYEDLLNLEQDLYEEERYLEVCKEAARYDSSELADARSESPNGGFFPAYQDEIYSYYSTPVLGVYWAEISADNLGNHYTVLTKDEVAEFEM